MDKLQIKKATLEEMIKEFKTNHSYKLLSEVQRSRVKMKCYEVTKMNYTSSRKIFFKDKIYEVINEKFFISTDIEMITSGERTIARRLKQYKYQLIDLNTLNTEFKMTVDMFYNGIKIPRSEIQLVYSDFGTFFCIPDKYENFAKLHILVRPYCKDITMNNNQLLLVNGVDNYYMDKNFIVYVDGKYTSQFTKFRLANNDIVININCPATSYVEICMSTHINKATTIPSSTSYFKIDGNYNFPIDIQNTIGFANGFFIDTGIKPITSNVFSMTAMSSPVDIISFYGSDINDISKYTDKIIWYRDKHDLVQDLINNTAPQYIHLHNLSDIDLSLDDFVKSRKNIDKYNEDKFVDIMHYDYEFYNMYINKFMEYVSKYMTIEYFDVTKFGITNLYRRDNRTEIYTPSLHMDFATQYVMIKVPNQGCKVLNIYVDGIRIFEFLQFYENDVSYIYLLPSQVGANSVVSIEKLNVLKKHKHLDVVTTNSTNITTSDVNIINGRPFIRTFYYNGVSNIYDPIPIHDMNITNGVLQMNYSSPLGIGSIVCISNINYRHMQRFTTYGKMSSVTFELNDTFNILGRDKEHYRVYKNGRLLPRSVYSIEYPALSNNLKLPKITINAKFTYGEVVYVECLPYRLIETYYERLIDAYGRIRPAKGILPTPFNDTIMSFYMNGRMMTELNKEFWTNNGVIVKKISTRKHLDVLLDEYLYNLIMDFSQAYNTGDDNFDEYIKSIMVGYEIDDVEPDMLDENKERYYKLYYELYMEFLKHNIIDFGQPMPDYIAIKYKDLMSPENVLYIKTDDSMAYWMPLDAELTFPGENYAEIMSKYYKLLDNISDYSIVKREDIPDAVFANYSQLFNKNVLVVYTPLDPTI